MTVKEMGMVPRIPVKNTNKTLFDSFVAARGRHQRGELDGALAIYSQLLSIDPADDEVLFLFGTLQIARGNLDVGLECLVMAQDLNPHNPNIPYSQGVFLQEAGRILEACSAYQRCVEIAPGHQSALENLAAGLYDTDQFEAGLVFANKALALMPESRLAIRAAANCLTALGERAKSLAVLSTGVDFHPAAVELRYHYACELMANGNFDHGLVEYEWRHQRPPQSGHIARQVPFPRWAGEPAQNKTILVYGDEGVGDELMFSQYVPALVNLGANCILECEPRLLPLFSRSFAGVRLLPRVNFQNIDSDSRLGEVDYAISSASLPRLLSANTRGTPFLVTDLERTTAWRSRLKALGGRLTVGVSWRGGANPKAHAFRSIAPGVFGGLMDDDVVFVNLQYGASPKECAQVSPRLVHFAEIDALRDLDGFCALVSALDLVVSVDNSTVHFAAALGVPAWLLLPRYAEWRWGRSESDGALWYAGLRYFRQQESGDAGWTPVVDHVRAALQDCEPAQRVAVSVKSPSGEPLPPMPVARHALVIGDTQHWYHWGCSCTSLGLQLGLRGEFEQISTLPLSLMLAALASPTSLADLDSDDFFNAYQIRCAEIVQKISSADAIFVNGEGSIHGSSAVALSLLYLGYAAKKRFGKTVHIVNHSCFPGNGLMADGCTRTEDFYARVYQAIDSAVLREKRSFDIVQAFGANAILGFDCLPLFAAQQSIARTPSAARRVVFGGSVAWSGPMVECYAALAERMYKLGYEVEVLSGSKAYLAGDEVGFVEEFHRQLKRLHVPHELHFALSERMWLQRIADAVLVVSGRFHYSIAAAFVGVSFIVSESNTPKIDGLLEMLDLPRDVVGISANDLPKLPDRALALLAHPSPGLMTQAKRNALIALAQQNFGANSAPVPEKPSPVILRAYDGASKGATAFFRNRPFLDTLCTLLTQIRGGSCSVLVHASSVGAEPWSLALWWLHRVLPRTGCDIQIFATDLNPNFLQVAQRGIYPAGIEIGMTPEEQNWFKRVGNEFHIPDSARSRVQFLPPMSFVDGQPRRMFDAVLIMNALTYVTAEDQTLALKRASAYTKSILGLTAFHPDTIQADTQTIGFEPCLINQQQIHDAWGDRLRTTTIQSGSPEYSWQLPPYNADTPEALWRFTSLFTRALTP